MTFMVTRITTERCVNGYTTYTGEETDGTVVEAKYQNGVGVTREMLAEVFESEYAKINLRSSGAIEVGDMIYKI